MDSSADVSAPLFILRDKWGNCFLSVIFAIPPPYVAANIAVFEATFGPLRSLSRNKEEKNGNNDDDEGEIGDNDDEEEDKRISARRMWARLQTAEESKVTTLKTEESCSLLFVSLPFGERKNYHSISLIEL